MNVTVDGIIYQTQSHGGISQLYSEILPRMCEQDPDLHIDLLTSGKCKKAPPVHTQIAHRILFPMDALLRPTRFWGITGFNIRGYGQHLAQPQSKGRIWHSTYFTTPYNWHGRIVVTVYDMISERFSSEFFSNPANEVYRRLKRNSTASADAIICISEATKRDVQEIYSIDSAKLHVIHLAPSPVFRQTRNGDCRNERRASKPFILYVGGRRAYKNFSGLLRAFSAWAPRTDIGLVVVGGPQTHQEREAAHQLKIENCVNFISGVDDEQLCLLYNQACAFVFPSLYEGFGIPLLEAMACGCPIVASRIPTSLEVAGNIPVYFELDDIDSLVLALDSIVAEGRDSDRVKLGLTHVEQFSWDRAAKETLNVYRDVLGKA